MALFKFRTSGDEPQAAPVQPDSIEMMRKRAKYRLAGAAILVLIGVIGFPMLFDKQPRPIAVDIPIEIPDRSKAAPLNIPAPPAAPAVQPEAAQPAPATAPVPATAAASGLVKKASEAAVPAAAAAPKIIANKASQASEKSTEESKVQALLNGKTPDSPVGAAPGRYVVQVGAFADAARAQEVRLKVEHAGLKTYTQVAGTKDGQRIRVRVGPFATKAEADKASEKIKKLALPAAILTL